jgi:hypothetical protein
MAALPPGCEYFGYRELEEATGGWARSNIIGDGGFGRVYRGRLRSGRLIAAKRLDRHGLQARMHAAQLPAAFPMEPPLAAMQPPALHAAPIVPLLGRSCKHNSGLLTRPRAGLNMRCMHHPACVCMHGWHTY